MISVFDRGALVIEHGATKMKVNHTHTYTHTTEGVLIKVGTVNTNQLSVLIM